MCGAQKCGKQDCTWGEKHRFECEARFVARMRNEARQIFLKNIERKRGEEYYKKLLAESRRQWEILFKNQRRR